MIARSRNEAVNKDTEEEGRKKDTEMLTVRVSDLSSRQREKKKKEREKKGK